MKGRDKMSSVTKSNRDIKSLQPLAQQAAQLFFDTCKSRDINVFSTEFHRSQERQNYLYCKGRTVDQAVRAGINREFAKAYCDVKEKQVTWTLKSNHTSGYAWDIAVSPPHDLYDFSIIAKAGVVAKELGIEWGGTWVQQDTPHFQIDKNWKPPVIKDELKDAVLILHNKGVINTPTSWSTLKDIDRNKRYLPELMANFIKIRFNVDLCCYNDSIIKLYQEGIISDLSVWADDKIPSANNIRFLLIKMAKGMM